MTTQATSTPTSAPAPSSTASGSGHLAPAAATPVKTRRRWLRLPRLVHTAKRPVPAPAAQPAATPQPPRTGGASPAGDRHIRGWSIATIVMVAVVGTAISSWHAFELVHGAGEPFLVALGYPLLIDGVIFMASMVILMCSRRRIPAPWLAWVALFAGALVTLAVNVAHGWHGGMLSRLVSAIPPLAVLGSYELLMKQIRMAYTPVSPLAVEEPVSQPEPPAEEVAEPPAPPKPPARTLAEAVVAAYPQADSIRGLARDFEISRSRVESILRQAGVLPPKTAAEEAADRAERKAGDSPLEPPVAPTEPELTEEEEARRAMALLQQCATDQPPTEADLKAAGLTEAGQAIIRKGLNMAALDKAASSANGSAPTSS